MRQSAGYRIMEGLSRTCGEASGLIFGAAFLLFVASAVLAITHLRLDPNRRDLSVAASPSHQRYVDFRRQFPLEDLALVIVTGPRPALNRRVVDQLAARLRAEPSLVATVYEKIDTAFARGRLLQYMPATDLAGLVRVAQHAGPLLVRLTAHPDLIYLLSDLNHTVQALLTRAEQGHTTARQLARERLIARQAAVGLPVVSRLLDDLNAAVGVGQPYRSPWQQTDRHLMGSFGVHSDRFPSSLYLTLQDGQVFLLLLRPRHADNLVPGLRRVLAEEQAAWPGVELGLTGKGVIDYDQATASTADSTHAMLLSLAGVCLLFLMTFHSWSRPLMATACLVLALVWTLGFVTAALGHLDTLTVIALPMLVGLGIDFAIQIITRYEEERLQEATPAEAARRTLTETGISVFTAGLVISLAFAAIALSRLEALQELALVVGVGVMLCVLAMLAVLPTWLMYSERMRLTPSTWRMWAVQGLLQADRKTMEYSPGVVGVAICLALIGLHLARQVPYDTNLLHLEANQVPSMIWERRLEGMAGGCVLPAQAVADNLAQARRYEREAHKLSSVAGCLSVASIMPRDSTAAKLESIVQLQRSLPPAFGTETPVRSAHIPLLLHSVDGLRRALLIVYPEVSRLGGQELSDCLQQLVSSADDFHRTLAATPADMAARRMQVFQHALFSDASTMLATVQDPMERRPMRLSDLPPLLRDNVVTADGRLLVAFFPRQDIWEPRQLEQFLTELRQIDPDVTGFPVEVYDSQLAVAAGYTRAMWCAVVAVLAVTLLHFRALVPTLFALAPVGLGLLWMEGLQTYFGIPFNMANQIVVPLLLGIGTANGVYLVRRMQEAGTTMVLGLSTGRALLVSNLMALIGFGSLLVAHYQGIFSIGLVMGLGLICVMLSSLVVLPACFELCRRHSPHYLWRFLVASV